MEEPPSTPGAGAEGSAGDLSRTARGGALNLVGAFTYGLTNALLLVVVANALGDARMGQFVLAIAVFNIAVKVAELGASTGFVRMVSAALVLGRAGQLPALVVSGLVPVAVAGSLIGGACWLAADPLGDLVAKEGAAGVTSMLRILLPFVPLAALYSVVVQGTRGFGTMRPQTLIEKSGRAAVQLAAVAAVLAVGAGPQGLALAWVLPTVGATAPAALWFRALARRAMADPVTAPPDAEPVERRAVGRAFWSFAAPRAMSQVFQVTVLWFDVLFIGALLGDGPAGVYAAATRFLIVGTFLSEAIMQVVAPQISGLVAGGHRRRAQQVYQAATAWQVVLVWPVFLGVVAFAPVLLGIYGAGFGGGAGALTILAATMLVTTLFGPSDTVILMSGRSRLSLVNTVVSVTLNLGGNIVLIPRIGLEGAALSWAASMLAVSLLPAVQAWRNLHLHPFGQATVASAAVAAVTVGVPCLVLRVAFGPTLGAFAAAVVVGGTAFAGVAWLRREQLGLAELGRALRPGSRRG